MRKLLIILAFCSGHSVCAQIYLSGYVGGAGYNGDLNEKTLKRIKPAVGATASYQVTNRLFVRTGLVLTALEGGDKWSGTELLKQNRNLSFKTDLTELSLAGELHFFDLNKTRWTPYIFGGVAVFHFDPYVMDSGKRVYLKPLSTEGQGLSGNSKRQAYSLNQFALPFGGGFKYVVNDYLLLGFEMNLRRTNTDYLDDVSTTYADAADLLKQRGETTVRLSYRGGEVPGGTSDYPDNDYPMPGSQRGGAKYKDWYYTAGFHLAFRLNNFGKSRREKKSYGCVSAPVPM